MHSCIFLWEEIALNSHNEHPSLFEVSENMQIPHAGNHQYIYIYIYIYIYCHPQTDCFVVSQLFSVTRHVERLKLGSKPTQLYVARQQGNNMVLCSNSSSIVRLFAFSTLPDTRVLNSFEELCIMQAAAENSFTRVLNPHGGAYIYIYIYI